MMNYHDQSAILIREVQREIANLRQFQQCHSKECYIVDCLVVDEIVRLKREIRRLSGA